MNLHLKINYFKVLLVILWALGLFNLIIPASIHAQKTETRDPQTLIAVIPKDFPPTYFRDPKSGEPAGLAVDLTNEIARLAGLAIKYRFGEPWEEIEQELLTGKADLIPLRVINDKTQQRFIFTKRLDATPVNYIVRTSDQYDPNQIFGKKVGVIRGSTADVYFKDRQDLQVVPYDSMEHLFMDLITGRINLALTVPTNLLKLAKEVGLSDKVKVIEPPVFEVTRGIALNKNYVELRDRLNRAIDSMQGTPEQRAIYQRWLGKPDSWWSVQRVAWVLGAGFACIIAALLIWRYVGMHRLTSALERQSALLTSLIDSIPDIIFFKDLKGAYIGVNRSCAEFLGQPQENIPGLTDYELFPSKVADVFRDNDLLALAAKTSRRNEEWLVYPNGRRMLVDTLKAPLINREGQIIGLLGVARDIMERHEAEEALQAADEALRQAHAQLEERVRQRTQELEKAQQDLIDQALEAGRAQIAAVVLHNIGNAITPMRMYVETLQTLIREQGLDYFRQGYLELAEHRHNLEYYVNADSRGRRVFEFLGALIEQSYNKRNQPLEVIDKINTTVEYIAQILTLQQDYFAGGHRNNESVDLNQLIDDALAMQMGALEKRQITVNKQLEPLLHPLLIDKSRLMQVIINLIKNAYEAIDNRHDEWPEKNICISSKQELQHIKVIITDTGIGIKPDKITTLFEFGLSHKGSTGVGLYYCKKFIEDYSGKIAISSDGFNQGATVTIVFSSQQ